MKHAYVPMVAGAGKWRTLTADNADDIFDSEEAAPLLRISSKTILRLAGDGRLPGRKVGRAWRFRRGDVLAWLSRQEDSQ